jgi:two-component system phosphate regulon response regulator PhoB
MGDTVLVVEDEADVVDLLRYNLNKSGFDVLIATSGLEGLEIAAHHRPDLILLDIMLPGMSGYDVCKKLRSTPETASIAIVMLTAKGETQERVKGLECGVDDYVTKPFSPRELILRIKAVLRRVRVSERGEVLEFDGFLVDKQAFEIRLDGTRIELTTTEFKLLSILLERRGRVQSREKLLLDVWGYNNVIDTRTVDTHVRRLREKLSDRSHRLETIRGEGYRFSAVE